MRFITSPLRPMLGSPLTALDTRLSLTIWESYGYLKLSERLLFACIRLLRRRCTVAEEDLLRRVTFSLGLPMPSPSWPAILGAASIDELMAYGFRAESSSTTRVH